MNISITIFFFALLGGVAVYNAMSGNKGMAALSTMASLFNLGVLLMTLSRG